MPALEQPDRQSAPAARPDHLLLLGRRALVTGASSGIGHDVARRLARAGAAVVINDHSHAEPAEALASEINAAGGKAFALAATFLMRRKSKNFSRNRSLPSAASISWSPIPACKRTPVLRA